MISLSRHMDSNDQRTTVSAAAATEVRCECIPLVITSDRSLKMAPASPLPRLNAHTWHIYGVHTWQGRDSSSDVQRQDTKNLTKSTNSYYGYFGNNLIKRTNKFLQFDILYNFTPTIDTIDWFVWHEMVNNTMDAKDAGERSICTRILLESYLD